MPFDDLKKKLGYVDSDAYLQAPVNIPGTEGLDPSAPPQAFLGQMLDKTVGTGNDTPTTDSVEPEGSPIDLLAGSLGSRFGFRAGEALDNEAGAVNFGKGVVDKTDKAQPIGRVFREETVPTKPNYGRIIKQVDEPLVDQDWSGFPEVQAYLDILKKRK